MERSFIHLFFPPPLHIYYETGFFYSRSRARTSYKSFATVQLFQEAGAEKRYRAHSTNSTNILHFCMRTTVTAHRAAPANGPILGLHKIYVHPVCKKRIKPVQDICFATATTTNPSRLLAAHGERVCGVCAWVAKKPSKKRNAFKPSRQPTSKSFLSVTRGTEKNHTRAP